MSEETMQTNEISQAAQISSLPKKDYTNAVYLTAEDTVAGSYAEPLSVEISEMYLEKVKSAYESTPNQGNLVMREALYSICILDQNRELIDRWDVDDYRTIRTMDGSCLWREGQIDELLTDIEKQYSLGYVLQKRVPGEQYFSVLTEADHASAAKSNQNNLEDPIQLDISADMLEELKANWQQIEAASTRTEDVRSAYTIVISNADGNAVQNWMIDAENRIYSCHGYELKGDFVRGWVDRVMQEMLNE
ncbi:MAG: hypothetical protein K5695_09580 [Oscillospiraceae bacterium]|nr:hypothetical protein [Oscillospiraceae bacterium]